MKKRKCVLLTQATKMKPYHEPQFLIPLILIYSYTERHASYDFSYSWWPWATEVKEYLLTSMGDGIPSIISGL